MYNSYYDICLAFVGRRELLTASDGCVWHLLDLSLKNEIRELSRISANAIRVGVLICCESYQVNKLGIYAVARPARRSEAPVTEITSQNAVVWQKRFGEKVEERWEGFR